LTAFLLTGTDHLLELDQRLENFEWLYASHPSGARAVLSTITGSMITVAGVLISSMIVVLTLASQQYGPRLVKNFIEDRPSQFVIGSFAACFIYSILIMRNIHSGEVDFVPHFSFCVSSRHGGCVTCHHPCARLWLITRWALCSGIIPQRVFGESEFSHQLAPNQMLLDDLLQHIRGAGVIPDALGIHHGDRAACADLEAIRLGAINQRFRPGEI